MDCGPGTDQGTEDQTEDLTDGAPGEAVHGRGDGQASEFRAARLGRGRLHMPVVFVVLVVHVPMPALVGFCVKYPRGVWFW